MKTRLDSGSPENSCALPQSIRCLRHGSTAVLLNVALIAFLLAGLGSWESRSAEPKKPKVADLIEGLQSGDKEIRREASYRLSQLGAEAKAAVPELIKALSDNERQVWFNSITALARIGPDAAEAVPALINELEHADRGGYHDQTRYRIAFALGSIGTAALPALTNALASDRDVMREGAAKAISWIGPPATNAISLLVKNLNDGDSDVREKSAEALGKIGPAAIPELEAGLKSDQTNTRAGAAQALEWMGEPAKDSGPQLAAALRAEKEDTARTPMIHALSKLNYDPPALLDMVVPLLRSNSESVRLEASNAIILMEPAATTSVPLLQKMVSSNDEGAIKVGATYLGDIGPDAAGAVPALIAARTKETATNETTSAIDEALIQIGAPAVPELVKVMAGANGDTNHWSVNCLRQLGSEAVPAMIDGLQSNDSERQLDALRVLALVGDEASSAIPDLERLAKQGAGEVRNTALTTLASAGAKPDIVAPLAETALSSGEPKTREAGAAALAQLGPGARRAIPSLINGLKDNDPSVAASCARALGKCGNAGGSAAGPLVDALQRTEPQVHEAVVGAIGELGAVARSAVPALTKLLPNTKPPFQKSIVASLGAMGASASAALPELEKNLTCDDADTRAACVTAMAQIETNKGRKVEMLKTALDDHAQVVRVAAIEELGKLGRAAEPAAEKLYALTESSTEREQALEVLAGMQIRSVPLLVRALGNSDPYVRQYAAQRLGELGKDAEEAAPELRKLLDDKEEFVKRAARSSLRDIRRSQ